ncbi:hypothetical protein [Streptomyces jumonjinensis]|uniref:hypothetical protein n=1 Tax=Streptomyces jumonjinensis TaxID=1945 RepID=UPI00378B4733
MSPSTTEPVRTMCGAGSIVPRSLAQLASRTSPDPLPGHPGELFIVRCHLERHGEGFHWAMVWPVDRRGQGMLWAHWDTGSAPTTILTLPVCPAQDGPHKECALYKGHPGGHSHELTAPETQWPPDSPVADLLPLLTGEALRTPEGLPPSH